MVVKNRVFMTPMSTNFATVDGYVTDEMIHHYARRAKGGVGLIISEVVMIEPTYKYIAHTASLQDDSYIEGWQKLANEVHKYGAKIVPQLLHPSYMALPLPGTPQLVGPSEVGPYYAKEPPRPLTIPEIHELVEMFGNAALFVEMGPNFEINAEEYATQMLRIIQDRSLRTKLGVVGYSRFLSRYTRKKMIAKTLDIYNSLF